MPEHGKESWWQRWPRLTDYRGQGVGVRVCVHVGWASGSGRRPWSPLLCCSSKQGFIWTKIIKTSELNFLESTVLLLYYFTVPASPPSFIPSFLHPNFLHFSIVFLCYCNWIAQLTHKYTHKAYYVIVWFLFFALLLLQSREIQFSV